MPYTRDQCKLFAVKASKGESVPDDWKEKCRGVKDMNVKIKDGELVTDVLVTKESMMTKAANKAGRNKMERAGGTTVFTFMTEGAARQAKRELDKITIFRIGSVKVDGKDVIVN